MSPRTLLKYERYVIVGSLGIAILLPFTYDPVTQFLIALPIIVLYNVSVLFVWIANRRKNRKTKQVVDSQAVEPPQPPPRPPLLKPAPIPTGLLPQPVYLDLDVPTPEQPQPRLLPVFDVATNLQSGNFLDLRPSK